MKRLFAMLLCGLMLVTLTPVQSFAAVKDVPEANVIPPRESTGSNVDPTKEGLEKAILSIKEKIAIPEEYSQFNYYFYDTSSYAEAYWSLTWTNPADYSNIQVNCDADYHITYYYRYNSSRKEGISKYLKKELKTTADNFINQIAPELKNNLEYINATYDGVYSGNYIYNYQRVNSSVQFPDNKVSVSVSSISGEVTYASINWLYDVSVPSSKVKLTGEEAAKLIKDNLKMKLVYRSNYYGIYDKFGNVQTKAYLVYEPTLSYISIDAKTGEVYLERSQWITVNDYTGANGSKDEAAADSGGGSRALTKEEIAKIEELKYLISKDKAIDNVLSNRSLYLDDTLKSYSATLNKLTKANGKSSYVWYITLTDPREIDYTKETDSYRAYASATVDAQTGKILSFYASTKNYYDEANNKWIKVDIPYSKEDCRVILEKFLKSQIKSRFDNSILVDTNDDYVVYYDKNNAAVYGGYRYQYNRTNEGVEYPYNNISGCVDGITGKIYSYSSYWDDSVVFEPTEGAMSADKAMEYYLGNEGYGLKYEINVINKYDAGYEKQEGLYNINDAYSVEYQIRLVYRPDINPPFISPFTGEQLDYKGEVYRVTPPYSYLDIADTPQNRNILLLADMNIGFKGDYFYPSQAITVGEMKKLLSGVGYAYYNEAEASAEDNIQITREEMAMTLVKSFGLEKLALLPGIYKTGYSDENSIASEYIGAVALAKGLGLMTADSYNNFNPKNTVTRAEAVDLLMNFIAAAQKGIYY